jgi:hypothetical protein
MDTIFVLRSTHADTDIEDDPKMSIVLRDALEKQAHRIVLASSGKL